MFISFSLIGQKDLNTMPVITNKSTIGTGNQTLTLGSISTYYSDEQLIFKNNISGFHKMETAVMEKVKD